MDIGTCRHTGVAPLDYISALAVCLSATALVQWRFLVNNELGCKWNSFCDCIFVPKGSVTLTIYSCIINIGCTLKIIQCTILTNYWGVFMCFYANIHAILELWVYKGSKLDCGKVGGGIYRSPATEVNHFVVWYSSHILSGLHTGINLTVTTHLYIE